MAQLPENPSTDTETDEEILKNSLSKLLQSSRGEIFYVLGKEGLTTQARTILDLDELEKLFRRVVEEIECEALLLCQRNVGDGPVRDFRIRKKVDELDFIETRIAVVGNVDTGKTTLLGVLTHNTNDDGRGSARLKLFHHKHEITTGRTSSVGVNIVGYDYSGNCLNDPDRGKLDWPKLCRKSSKVVSLIDLAGHEKYLKTTISGLFGYMPDACMLIVGANAGLIGMTKEHFWLATSLDIPCFFVVTKIDMCPAQKLTETLQSLVTFIRSPFVGRTPVKVKNESYVFRCAEMLSSLRLCPIFMVSNVTGTDIGLLRRFIDLIQPNVGDFKTDGPFEAIVHNVFNVPNVGIVVSVIIMKGNVKINDGIVIGPDYFGRFSETIVKNINRSKLFVNSACHGQLATLFIRKIDVPIRKGMLVTVSPKPAYIVPSMEFEADVRIMQHPTTISVGYHTHLHVDGIRQTAKILSIGGNDYLRTGDSASVHFRFTQRPEFIRVGAKFVFRDGLTKGLGLITRCFQFVPKIPASKKTDSRKVITKRRHRAKVYS